MLKLFKRITKKEALIILVCIVLTVVSVWLDLKMPDYMSNITMLVKTEGSKIGDIIKEGGYMLLCAAGSLVSSIGVGYFTAYISSTFSLNTRKRLFAKVESFSMEEVKKFSTSSLITRTTNDITNVEMLLGMGLQMIFKAPILAVWAILKIVDKGWQWSAATGVAVAFMLFVIGILLITVFPKFKIVQKYIDNINELARENLKGLRVVRAFNAEKYQEDKFEGANEDLTKLQLFTQRMMSVIGPGMYLILNLLPLAIYVIGASLIDAATGMEKLTLFSDMVVFTSYAMQVIMSFLMLAMIFIFMPRAGVSANRINEVLDEESKIRDGKGVKKTNEVGTIEFRDVSFKYPDSDEYVIENISFKCKKGDTVAFIGSTGSGKSTLINLVPRFYDATKGEVLIDNENVKDYTLEELHYKLGYVPQKAVMFNESVKYNLCYGKSNKKITKEDMDNAIRVAQASDFINGMEKGYDSNIAQGGTNISGGQKQRVAIARAISRKPEIYIFDDSFSALDYKTDYLLRRELKKYTKDATCLIVAQRIGTIKDADIILVLDEGKCVGMGKHKDLLKNCEVYKEIAYSQLSKEELENV